MMVHENDYRMITSHDSKQVVSGKVLPVVCTERHIILVIL